LSTDGAADWVGVIGGSADFCWVDEPDAPGTKERAVLVAELDKMAAAAPFKVPAFIGGKEVSSKSSTEGGRLSVFGLDELARLRG